MNLLASQANAAAAEPVLAAFRAPEAENLAAFDALLRANPRLAQE